jgi:large subunit ribosomal protein L21
MYAIVRVGGKQYRVEKGDSIVVDRMRADEGAKVALDPLLFRDSKHTVFDGAEVEKVKVEAVVAGHERGRKIHVLKFRPKKGYKRRTGHRAELTRLEISDIKLLQRRSPAVKGEAKEAEEAPAKKTPAKKPAAAKRPSAARKPAAGKPAAKKPATRKPSTTRKKQEAGDGS